ncbi:MAG: Uma2 family endonuclease [Myxococcota bacterium]
MTEGARVMSYADYLAFEREAEEKHEYVNGAVIAMAGGSREHARLAMRLALRLGLLAEAQGCTVLSSDGRIRIEATGRSTYPDLSVVCGPPAPAADDPEATTNPILLVEVLSETTEREDRGPKWAHYQRLSSLRGYLLVSQSEARLELFTRSEPGEGWRYRQAVPGESLALPFLRGTLDVDDVYAS